MNLLASRRARVWRHLGNVAAGVLLAHGLAVADQVPNQVLGAGGGLYETPSMRLQYTIAEPLATPVQAGTTVLIGGFQASFGPTLDPENPDLIFSNGFEPSTP